MGWRLVLIVGIDRGTFCLGHGAATGSSQGAGTVRTGTGCVPRLWQPRAGTGDGCVSAPAALWGSALSACHGRPLALFHQHPHSPKGAKLDFKARPLFGWGQPLRLQADVFPHALSYISQEIPRKTTLGGQRSCFLTHALHDLSPERLGGQIATPKRVRQQHPNSNQRAPALTCYCSVPPVPGHLQVPDLSQSLQNHRGAGEAGKR